jgi:phycobilisome rod-core linker protein
VALPLLEYSYKSQNERVVGYEVAGEEQPMIYTTENMLSSAEMDELIWAGYRQIFSEHQILSSTRQKFLESQIRNGQITVQDFIRGLLLSDPFRRLNYDTNSNYRFVEICVQRVLGRDVYNEREKIAWSIVVAQQGLQGFVDTLLNSDEYLENFGFDTVPYQRRRILPQRSGGETPFNLKTPRYGEYHRGQLGFPQVVWQNVVRRFIPQEQQVTAGNPSLYMGMAREISPFVPNIPRVSTTNMNYLALVPKK